MIDHIGAAYAENETELSWLIGPSIESDENLIGQLNDWSYKCSLHQKQNWAIVTNQIKYNLWWKLDWTMMWPIV